MLTRLIRFTISGGYNHDLAWHTMPETFHRAFLHYLQPQVMKEVDIRLISSFPLSLFNNCMNVRATLNCCETQYDNKSNPGDVSRSYAMPFEHLFIMDCSKMCVENIASWAKMHGLRSLKYVVDNLNDSPQQLLVACSNSLDLDILEYDINTSYEISNDSAILINGDGACFPFTLASLRHLTQLTIDTKLHLRNSADECWTLFSPILAITELVSTARPTLKKISIKIRFILSLLKIEQLPDPVGIWFPFIPLADKCSSASISIYIFPSFVVSNSTKEFAPCFFSPLAAYKGLTPYVQSGVVVISDGFLEDDSTYPGRQPARPSSSKWSRSIRSTT